MIDSPRQQSICLTMILRDEAHIVGEVLDATAPYIDYWVVVDTGSTDGTQDLIRGKMERLGVLGELHERPWRDFGSNRSEVLTLAQGKADYIWMMDADDTVIGVPPFRGLTADCYGMRICEDTGHTLWRRQLFRDGVPWYYKGVQPATRGDRWTLLAALGPGLAVLRHRSVDHPVVLDPARRTRRFPSRHQLRRCHHTHRRCRPRRHHPNQSRHRPIRANRHGVSLRVGRPEYVRHQPLSRQVRRHPVRRRHPRRGALHQSR